MQKTCVIEARVDIRLLASLDAFLQKQNVIAASKSELVRNALTLLHEILAERGQVEDYTLATHSKARAQLARLGNLNKNAQGERELFRKIAEETACLTVATGANHLNRAQPLTVGDIAALITTCEDEERLLTTEEWERIPEEMRIYVPTNYQPEEN